MTESNTPAATDNSITPGELPSYIPSDSPVGQVVNMAQSGVDESVIMSFVKNFGSVFDLDSTTVIYLKDIGLPNDVINAMIQRNQELGVAVNNQPTTPTDTPTNNPPAVVTENYFYSTLAPYGGWVNIDGYGLCWRPTTVIYDAGWQPYCDHGRWVYTDYGWYWVSDYSWGATTFHYGRWFHHPRWGWCWWPETTWAPSWVCWRYSNDYCGWAPLPPHTIYQAGVGFIYNGAAVKVGFDFGLTAASFTFVATKNFYDSHPNHYRVAADQVTKIYNHTTIINNFNFNNHNQTIVNDGIPPQHITAVSGVQIHPVTIQTVNTRNVTRERFNQNNRTLLVNRPHFTQNNATSLNQGIRPHPVAPAQDNPSHPTQYHGTQVNQPGTPYVAPNPQSPAHNYNHNWYTSPRQQEQQIQHPMPHPSQEPAQHDSSPGNFRQAPSGSRSNNQQNPSGH
ncbi:MAG TPA: DUF6600 domain-containing protein [Verrucomicrobiae bacterium]|nr:DUF6600 domain-containing protein [Verrucomicrobiae bacterium]